MKFKIAYISVLVMVSLSLVPCLGWAARKNNIILITLDTTRADRMGFLGCQQNLTPHLDRIAQQSTVFLNAYSQAPLTTTSHATILTGTYPQFHNVSQPGVPLRDSVPYLPQVLRNAGYNTGAFVGALIMQAKGGGAPGFDRGFSEYDAGFQRLEPRDNRYASVERRAEEVIAHALAWIANAKSPFFAWIHIYDPHAPYDPPEPFRARFRSQPYDGEIAYVDSALANLFGELQKRNLYDSSLLAIMADHGESLGEHGEQGHGLFLYDTTIRVPLIIKLPGQRFGEKIGNRVELVDVVPTILGAVEVRVPASVQGKSLQPLIASTGRSSGGRDERAAYSQTDYPQTAFGWSSLQALRADKYLFVQAPRRELYNTEKDPAEQHNISSASPAITDALLARLTAFRKMTRSDASATANLDREQAELLRSLGYLASNNPERMLASASVDPKDKVEISNEMTEIAFILDEGRDEEARRRLEAVIAKDPELFPAYQMLGLSYMKQGEMAKGLLILKQAVERFPTRPEAHLELAFALIQSGDLNSAVPEMESAANGSPQSPQVHFELARLYFNLGNMEKAKKAALQGWELDPHNYEINLILGATCLAQHEALAAIPYLKAASNIQPHAAKPHEYLSHAYEILGERLNAIEERALVQKLTKAN